MRLRAVLALATTLAAAMPLHAPAAPDDGPWRLGGFGTLAYTRANIDGPRFRTLVTQEDGAGRSGSLLTDSRFGTRATYRFNPNVEFTAQLLAKKDQNAHTNAAVDWAYLNFKASDDLSIRVGRIRLPYYVLSDSWDVGYSYMWVRAPVEIYSMMVTQNVDGADLIYRRPIGPWTLTLQPSTGRAPKLALNNSSSIQMRTSGVAATLADGTSTLRFAAGSAKVSAGSQGAQALVNSLESIGYAQVADDYRMDDMRWRYTNLGYGYENHPWFLHAEATQLNVDRASNADTMSWFASGGRRFGEVSVYLMSAGMRSTGLRSENGLPSIPPFAPLIAGMNEILQASFRDQRTISAGARWDLRPGLALKAQYDRVRVESGARGNWSGAMPAGARPQVLSFALDFVF